MLKLSIHAGLLAELKPENQIAVLDIAYAKRAYLSDFVTAMQLQGSGELPPSEVKNYPRWSASVWDLVARGITSVLYRAEVAPPMKGVDRRCAYATKMCAVIHSVTAQGAGRRLATVELKQPGRKRGEYEALFTEDILGERRAAFEYGTKVLNPADLLLRAICHSLWGKDVLGPRPALILPTTVKIDGKERFHLEALAEPARTGFKRHQAKKNPVKTVEDMPLEEAYVDFLQGK